MIDTFFLAGGGMVIRMNHYLRLLKAELQDVMEDISMVIDGIEKRYAKNDVSFYVRQENEGVLRRELGAIANFIAIVDEIVPSNYTSIPEIESAIISKANEIVTRQEEPTFVLTLLNRKLVKVREFISTGDNLSVAR